MIDGLEFMAPTAEVIIGPWKTRKIHSVRVVSSRKAPIDLATIEIPIEGVSLDAIAEGMEVEIFLGYREYGLWLVFSGVVVDVSWGELVRISAKDGMEKLRETRIIQTFVDAQPREILRFCFERAGVANFEISQQELSRRHYFVAANQTVLQVQKLVNQTWDLDWEFYREPEGEVICRPWKETQRYQGGTSSALLEYGKNIFDLWTSDYQIGGVRTILLPMLRHGQIITLSDRRFWQTETEVKIDRITMDYGVNRVGMVMEWEKVQQK